MYKCHRSGCKNKVKQNEYKCKNHRESSRCNYVSSLKVKCRQYVYDEIYCFVHYYMEQKYIVLKNERILLGHPLCNNQIIINSYIAYHRDKTTCKIFSTHMTLCDKKSYTTAIHYYTYVYRRWVTMYLVMKVYLPLEALDIFSNVASNYIFL